MFQKSYFYEKLKKYSYQIFNITHNLKMFVQYYYRQCLADRRIHIKTEIIKFKLEIIYKE